MSAIVLYPAEKLQGGKKVVAPESSGWLTAHTSGMVCISRIGIQLVLNVFLVLALSGRRCARPIAITRYSQGRVPAHVGLWGGRQWEEAAQARGPINRRIGRRPAHTCRQ